MKLCKVVHTEHLTKMKKLHIMHSTSIAINKRLEKLYFYGSTVNLV